MTCIKCSKPISMTDKYFALSEVTSHNNPHDFFICESCSETVTPMELYMDGHLVMANAEDDMMEVEGVVVVDHYDYKPTPEELATAEHVVAAEEVSAEN